MAEEFDKGSSLGTRRFRLPKLFAETDEANTDEALESEEIDVDANAQPGVPASGPGTFVPSAAATASMSTMQTPSSPHDTTDSSTNEEILEYVAGMAQELLSLRQQLQNIHGEISDLNSRESTQEKVFNTLHAELSGYKKDFIYEHLKPVVRPLLFLYDSLEQFDAEVTLFERPPQEEQRVGLSPRAVRDNITFFRDQLVEALRVCEVTMMEGVEGPFNPKLQKAIEVTPVDPSQDNIIQRVVRSGWYLNGQLLRPAEVIVGRGR